MEPAHVLPFFVAVWCVAFLARALRQPALLRSGWTAKTVAVLAGLGAAVWTGSAPAIYGVSAAWAAFVLAPVLAGQAQARALSQLRPDRAYVFARIAAALHPFDGARRSLRVQAALARAQADPAGGIGDLHALLAEGGLPADVRPQLHAVVARVDDDWGGFLKAYPTDAATPPAAQEARLRALGETGRVAELVASYEASPPAMRRSGLATLMLLAFGGRPAGVDALLDGPLAALHPTTADYWRATAALQVDRDDAEARAALHAAASGPHPPPARAAARRLQGELGDPKALDAAARAALDRAERQAVADLGRRPASRGAPLTLALVAANLLGFAAELRQGGWDGPLNLDALYDLGALWAPAVLDGGEWWRLAAAMFLHLGWLHLALNLLALLLIGRLVERALGTWRFAFVYAAAGLGGMAAVLALMAEGWIELNLLVGASGAIMGLLGALGALALSDALAGSRPARRRLIEVAVVLALQIVFDALTPQVSGAAHIAGFAIGAAAAALIARIPQRRVQPP